MQQPLIPSGAAHIHKSKIAANVSFSYRCMHSSFPMRQEKKAMEYAPFRSGLFIISTLGQSQSTNSPSYFIEAVSRSSKLTFLSLVRN